MSHFQVDALEHDASQVLNLVRSTKNSLALINKIPPDVLSFIPNYWEDSNRDTSLINLTHVCRSWRELFISCPLLWACLDCTSVDKTKTYYRTFEIVPSGDLPPTVQQPVPSGGSAHSGSYARRQTQNHIGRRRLDPDPYSSDQTLPMPCTVSQGTEH